MVKQYVNNTRLLDRFLFFQKDTYYKFTIIIRKKDGKNTLSSNYDDGYETAKEENTNETMDKILILRDMIAVGSSDKNIVEKLKEILRDEGEL